MKGIAHFVAGVALASCFPEAVRQGLNGNPLYFILGGIAGLLPDTLDFKFARFFFRHDVEIMPDPNIRPGVADACAMKSHLGMIAEAVATAFNRALVSRKPVSIKLNTMQTGPNAWQPYLVTFDTARREVAVRYSAAGWSGDAVRATAASKAVSKEPEGRAALLCPVKLDYEASIVVDILDGPDFRMVPTPDGKVMPCFLPWHRQWSHSVLAALVLAAAGRLLFGRTAALVLFGAYLAHLVADQLGFMGSALCFPIRRERVEGLKVVHAGDALVNFGIVWVSCLLVFWNLYRAAPAAARGAGLEINPIKLAVFGALLPWAMLRMLVARLCPKAAPAPAMRRRKRRKRCARSGRQAAGLSTSSDPTPET